MLWRLDFVQELQEEHFRRAVSNWDRSEDMYNQGFLSLTDYVYGHLDPVQPAPGVWAGASITIRQEPNDAAFLLRPTLFNRDCLVHYTVYRAVRAEVSR